MRPNSPSLQLLIVIGLGLASCAGQNWEQVREQDTPAVYRRFLADHPRSPHAAEANERLAVLQLEREPTVEALARFQKEHPQSQATADLTRRVETRLFDAARAEATPAAYDRFLARFPDDEFSARARGNAEYLRAGGFAGRPDALAAFVQQNPASDYTIEAQRTLAALDARRSARLDAVALRIEIAAGIGEVDRLRNVFAARAREAYAAAGIPLVDGAATALLLIRHEERAASARDEDGRLARPGLVAETTVSLQRNGDAEPIWTERFSVRIQDADRREGGSALFARSAAGFWERFFVPVASWPTQVVRRTPWSAGGGLADVAVDVGRAIALSPDGSFRELDLSDPAAPRVIAHYKRPPGIARFSGVYRAGTRVVLFGEDGLEVVARDGATYRRVFATRPRCGGRGRRRRRGRRTAARRRNARPASHPARRGSPRAPRRSTAPRHRAQRGHAACDRRPVALRGIRAGAARRRLRQGGGTRSRTGAARGSHRRRRRHRLRGRAAWRASNFRAAARRVLSRVRKRARSATSPM